MSGDHKGRERQRRAKSNTAGTMANRSAGFPVQVPDHTASMPSTHTQLIPASRTPKLSRSERKSLYDVMRGTGCCGKWNGGDGTTREVEVRISHVILSEHRPFLSYGRQAACREVSVGILCSFGLGRVRVSVDRGRFMIAKSRESIKGLRAK